MGSELLAGTVVAGFRVESLIGQGAMGAVYLAKDATTGRSVSAALGMLSCKPAHAARRSDSEPSGIRSSSAPTRRRNARICCRVSLSRVSTDLPVDPTRPVATLGPLGCASVPQMTPERAPRFE